MRLRKTTLVSKITFLKKKQTKACQNRNFKGLKRGSSGSFVAKSCRQLSTRHLKRYLSQGTKGRNFVHLPKKKKQEKERERGNELEKLTTQRQCKQGEEPQRFQFS